MGTHEDTQELVPQLEQVRLLAQMPPPELVPLLELEQQLVLERLKLVLVRLVEASQQEQERLLVLEPRLLVPALRQQLELLLEQRVQVLLEVVLLVRGQMAPVPQRLQVLLKILTSFDG